MSSLILRINWGLGSTSWKQCACTTADSTPRRNKWERVIRGFRAALCGHSTQVRWCHIYIGLDLVISQIRTVKLEGACLRQLSWYVASKDPDSVCWCFVMTNFRFVDTISCRTRLVRPTFISIIRLTIGTVYNVLDGALYRDESRPLRSCGLCPVSW